MATFEHAVLFCKENCAPCLNTKKFIAEKVPNDLLAGLSILQKEKQTALVELYGLELYPTLLILDKEGHEIDRCVGGKNIRANITQFLTEIFYARCI